MVSSKITHDFYTCFYSVHIPLRAQLKLGHWASTQLLCKWPQLNRTSNLLLSSKVEVSMQQSGKDTNLLWTSGFQCHLPEVKTYLPISQSKCFLVSPRGRSPAGTYRLGPVRPSVCASVRPSVRPSVHPSVRPSAAVSQTPLNRFCSNLAQR